MHNVSLSPHNILRERKIAIATVTATFKCCPQVSMAKAVAIASTVGVGESLVV